MTDQPAPYHHVRTTDSAGVEPGVYRVVGTPADQVTLLRVGDEDGNRRVTGRVVQVGREALSAEFEPAENPDAGFGLTDLLDRLLASFEAVYWLVRR